MEPSVSPGAPVLNTLLCFTLLILLALQASGRMEIPRFYFPDGKPVAEELRSELQRKTDALLKRFSSGLPVPAIKELLKDVSTSQFLGLHSGIQQTPPSAVLSVHLSRLLRCLQL